MSNKGYGYGFAFLSGILLGVAGGVLFAPKKGEELRKDIKIKSDEVYEKVASYDYSSHKEALVNKVDDFKSMVQDLDKEKVKDISLESLENLKGKAEDLVSSAKREAKKVRKSVDEPVVEEVETEEVEAPVTVESLESTTVEEDEDLFNDL